MSPSSAKGAAGGGTNPSRVGQPGELTASPETAFIAARLQRAPASRGPTAPARGLQTTRCSDPASCPSSTPDLARQPAIDHGSRGGGSWSPGVTDASTNGSWSVPLTWIATNVSSGERVNHHADRSGGRRTGPSRPPRQGRSTSPDAPGSRSASRESRTWGRSRGGDYHPSLLLLAALAETSRSSGCSRTRPRARPDLEVARAWPMRRGPRGGAARLRMCPASRRPPDFRSGTHPWVLGQGQTARKRPSICRRHHLPVSGNLPW